MKQISDKELDHLFKSNLYDFELKPSENSWNIIQEQVKGKSSKKKLSANWLIAASILFVIGLGWSFFNADKEVIQLKGKAAPLLTDNQEDTVTPFQKAPIQQKETASELSIEENKRQNEARFRAMLTATKTNNKKNTNSAATIKSTTNVLIAKSKVENQEVKEASLIKDNIGSDNLILKKEQDAMVLALDNKNQEEDRFLAHHVQNEDLLTDKSSKIKSVGDLVNFVVGKIDKRPDKILHISKTEESDMEITGINLGLFKYRKN